MAKVQLLQRLRLVPAPSPDPVPLPDLKPIAPVHDADQRILSFPRGPAPGLRGPARRGAPRCAPVGGPSDI